MILLPRRRVGQGKGGDIKTCHFHASFLSFFQSLSVYDYGDDNGGRWRGLIP
jgi:hypothetical protein